MVVAKREPRVQIATDYLAQKRTQRRPQCRFNLRTLPYEIQPNLLMPVLPGETLTSVMLQQQTWSHPLKSDMRNIGWWHQQNVFYVRHRDLPESVRTILAAMMLDPETDTSSLEAVSASAPLYTFAGGINWASMCLQHVVSEYFRDEGEDWNVATGPTGLPLAQIYGRGTADGFERLTLDDDYEDRRVDMIDGDGHLYADDMSTMWGHYMALRDAGLTEMDYQDFMKTYGSTVREDEASPNLHRAEDVWMLRESTYPTNTVEPTTGVPAVAVGWRVQKQGGKRMFFDEPGFLFGVQTIRPKVYLKNQKGSIAGLMRGVQQWLPAVLHGQADLGHVLSAYGEGPVPNVFLDTVPNPDVQHGYWLDIRDLLLYGDQYINYAVGTEMPFVSLPAANGMRRYASSAEIDDFFSGTAKGFETDGIMSLSIMSRQKASTSGLVLGKS